jgi:hypothetical protein
MDELSSLLRLFETFRETLNRAAPSKRLEAIKKAATSLKACINVLEPAPKKPTQKELKERLLTDRTALKIRTYWTNHKTLIDLGAMAREIGITLNKPSIDHIIIAYYYPSNRLDELATRFEKIAASDPATKEIQRFQEWRGELRALKTQEEMERAVQQLLQKEGADNIRLFAAHLNTKDSSGKRKLPKTATQAKLVEAVAAHLWKEKIVSKAQEGIR